VCVFIQSYFEFVDTSQRLRVLLGKLVVLPFELAAR